MHSKNLNAYLSSAAAIAGLLPQAERLIELRRIYSKLLPQQLLRSSSIVNCRRQTVIIFAENNSVAAKLRLLSPRLVNDFSKFGVEITGIHVEVQPSLEPVCEMVPKHAQLSPAGAESLAALAKQLPDSKLKQTLAAMAARGKSTQDPDPQAQGARRRRNPK